jgi:hypothetical protein
MADPPRSSYQDKRDKPLHAGRRGGRDEIIGFTFANMIYL